MMDSDIDRPSVSEGDMLKMDLRSRANVVLPDELGPDRPIRMVFFAPLDWSVMLGLANEIRNEEEEEEEEEED